jgi:hypothetical protein
MPNIFPKPPQGQAPVEFDKWPEDFRNPTGDGPSWDPDKLPYVAADGLADAYTADIDPAPDALVDGMGIVVKIPVENTGASTLNLNGLGPVPIKKANGNDVAAGNLRNGGIYHLRYDGVNFILQGEGGEYGTATADDVLVGKTIGTENGLINGTMPDRGGMIITPGDENIPIPVGYHDGTGYVVAIQPKGKIYFRESGTFFVPEGVTAVDVFLVGGGGGGSGGNQQYMGAGGGGGYTATYLDIPTTPGEKINITVGAGGAGGSYGAGGDGGYSEFKNSSYRAAGGKGGKSGSNYSDYKGGDGGSGGGSGGNVFINPFAGGSDGGNGQGNYPGIGQGTTTREFGEADALLYAGGGGGASIKPEGGGPGGDGGGGNGGHYSNGQPGQPNTGGGGGGGGGQTAGNYGGNGGSGIVVVRWGY